MNDFPHISGAEMTVLRTLWAAKDQPMTVAEVCAALPDQHWNYKTVGTFLLRLEEKGAVKSEKAGRANHYRSAFTEEEYQRAETKAFLQSVHRGSMRSMLAALYGGTPTPEAVDELKRWLEEM